MQVHLKPYNLEANFSRFFERTQVFANPTDLASFGVWKMFSFARHLVLMVSEE